MMQQKSKEFPIPLSYFSMALGSFSLGLAWKYAAMMELAPIIYSEVLLAFTTMFWLFLFGAYIVKLVRYPQAIKNDFSQLITCCFFSLLPITMIMRGIVVYPYHMFVSSTLIYIGVAIQLILMATKISDFWRGSYKWKALIPALYLPLIATNFVATVGMVTLGNLDVAIIFLGMGLFSWLTLEPNISLRMRIGQELTQPVRGIIGIQLAPSFVGCSAYLACNGGKVDFIVLLLVGYGLLQFLMLARLGKWILAGGFSMSLWSFSFGFASMAGCGFHLILQNRLVAIGYLLVGLGTVLVLALWISTIYKFIAHIIAQR